ncbi:MAG: NTP transferase domain-containing protein [Rhizobiales bacterium]|nr:NTP transferase domain-containing protein [Hyphomicrobiales bacterium]
MIFGARETAAAEGCYLAHAIACGGMHLQKGHRLTRSDLAALSAEGVMSLVVAELESGDVHEEEAARRIGRAAAGAGVRTDPAFTGRVNLFATGDGLLVVDVLRVNCLNRLHPALTIATRANHSPVEAGRMVATVKIIPFAAPESAISAAEALGAMVHVAPYQRQNVVLVATQLPTLKASTMDKTRRILDDRLKRAGARVIEEFRVPHNEQAVEGGLYQAMALSPDLVVLFGASATVDIGDVAPAGLCRAGGRVQHFGMPVDPGNLLFLGALQGTPVIGAPGCARSPVENGFDFILNRIIANIEVNPEEIMDLGVGGLLMEIVSRPQPRSGPVARGGPVAAVVLAAGKSTRMGGPNKLLATIDGVPLVRHVVTSLAASKTGEIIVVTGDRAAAVEEALAGMPVRFAFNPDFAEGLSTSLRVGIAALADDVDAALIALGDMPFIDAAAFDRVIDAYVSSSDTFAVVATANGKRGNPVLWSRRFFDDLKKIRGDTGARHLIGANEAFVAEVEIGEAASLDLDTPEALRAAGGRIGPDTER